MTLANDQIERGREALARLEKDTNFADWVVVGQALKIGRAEVVNTIKASGGTYSLRMTAWLKTQGFDSIDKGVRSDCSTSLTSFPRYRLGGKHYLLSNDSNATTRIPFGENTKVPQPAARKGGLPRVAHRCLWLSGTS
jgi:hypothetical protein